MKKYNFIKISFYKNLKKKKNFFYQIYKLKRKKDIKATI